MYIPPVEFVSATMEESTRVFGVGVGLFIIVLVWVAALVLLLILARMDVGSTLGIIGLAVFITFILLIVPREEKKETLVEEEPPAVITDSMFIFRTIVVVFVSLSAVAGSLIVAVDYGLHAVRPSQVKKVT